MPLSQPPGIGLGPAAQPGSDLLRHSPPVGPAAEVVEGCTPDLEGGADAAETGLDDKLAAELT